MVTKPPGAGVSEFVAYVLVDELIRTLLPNPAERRALVERVIANVSGMNVRHREAAVRVLKEMLDGYRHDTG